MASGKAHTKATIILSILTTPLIYYYLLIPIGVILGLWFSPDLDTRSDPYNRWGPLKIIWWPYQAIFNHRSPWTHLPIISTIIRIIYVSPIYLTLTLTSNITIQPYYLIGIVIGLMLSDTLHAIMDLA